MSFSDLKKRSTSSLQALVQEAEKINKSSKGGDDRLWKPELDNSGNGYAVIRFIIALVAILVYTGRDFLGSLLEERKATIVKGVQDAEDRLSEAERRLSEAQKQLNQDKVR